MVVVARIGECRCRGEDIGVPIGISVNEVILLTAI